MSNRRKRSNTTDTNTWGHIAPRIDHTRDEPTNTANNVLMKAHHTARIAGEAVATDTLTSEQAGITCCPHLDTDNAPHDWYANTKTPLHWTCYNCIPRSKPWCDACGKTEQCGDAVMARNSNHCNDHITPETPSLTMVALVCNTCYGTPDQN